MTTKVNISVKGRSILYLKDGYWNVVFITDTCHLVNFTDPLLPATRIGSQSVNRTINFTLPADASPAVPIPADPATIAQFLNLSDPYMHGVRNPPGQTPLSNLEVRHALSAGHKYVWMRIPFGTLYVPPPLSDEYYIELVDPPPSAPTYLGRGVAQSFVLSADIADSAELTMKISGMQDRVYPLTSSWIDLTFNNDCEPGPDYNDSIDNYDWLYDITSVALAPPKQFLTGKVSSLPSIREKLDALQPVVMENLQNRNQTGDCDPVIIDPPPG